MRVAMQSPSQSPSRRRPLARPGALAGPRLVVGPCLVARSCLVAWLCTTAWLCTIAWLCALAWLAPMSGAWAAAGVCTPTGGDPGAILVTGLPMGGALGAHVGGSGVDEFLSAVSGSAPRPAPLLCDAPLAGSRLAGGAGEPASLPGPKPSRAAGNPVDVVTGNKYERHVDAVLPHVQSSALSAYGLADAFGLAADDTLNLLFARHYNSRSDFALSLGRGWSHTFETRLARIERNGRIVLQVVQADGRRLTFEAKPHDTGRVYGTSVVADGLVEEHASSGEAAFVWRWPGGRRIAFDADGRLSSITSADLDTIRLHRDDAGRLVEVRDNAGRSFAFSWSGARLVRLLLPDGQPISYDYDAHGQLAAVRYPDGRATHYHYEDARAFHLLTGITDTDGRRSDHAYDDAQRVIRTRAIGAPPHRALRFEYRQPARAGESGLTTVRQGDRVSRFRWFGARAGREPQLVESSGDGCERCPPVGTTARFDARGRIVRAGNLHLRHDALGRVTQRRIVDANGRTRWSERLAYAGNDALAGPVRIERSSVVAGRRAVIELGYNERSQLESLHFAGYAPDSASGASSGPTPARPVYARLRLEYAPVSLPSAGRLQAIVREAPGGAQRTSFVHDTQRRLVRIVHGSSMQHDIERDAIGRAVRERLPDGHTRTRRFDRGWRLEQTSARGMSLRFGFDAAGRPRTLAWSDGRRWTLHRDAQGLEVESNHGWRRRVVGAGPANALAGATGGRRVAAPAGPRASVPAASRSTYAPGLPLAIAHAQRGRHRLVDLALRRSEWLRDDLGRLVQASSPQEGTRHYAYDDYGRLARIELADGSYDAREYDRDGRIARREQVAGKERVVTRFVHDGARLVAIAHPSQTTTARHDVEGRLVELVHRRDERVLRESFEYDERGRLSSHRLPDGSRLLHEYDERGRPSRLSIGLAGSGSVRLLAQRVPRSGMASSGTSSGTSSHEVRLGNGLRYVRVDDPLGRPLSMTWTREPGTPAAAPGDPALPSRRLQWHPSGTPLSISHEWGEDRYGYDRLGRLIVRERHGSAAAVASRARHVEYFAVDALGERMAARLRDGSEWHPAAFERDAAGLPTRIGTLALRYGAQHRILEARSPQATTAYRYDALGRRISKTTKTVGASGGPTESQPRTTGFLHRGHALAAETGPDGRLLRQYLRWDGRLVAVLDHDARSPRLTWLHTDHLGAPIAATDEAARVVWRGDRDAYGRLAFEEGQFRQPLRLPGQYFDAETGLHDNVLRSYDPAAGAYLEPDPLGPSAGLHPYVYADGNPVAAADPLGLILIAFDGTGNGATGRDGEDITNVRKFFESYEGPDKWYMSGVGLDDPGSGIQAGVLEAVDARSARERVDWMVGTLDSFLGDAWIGRIAPVDVIGFSRGAAMARDFVNRISDMIADDHFRDRGVCVDLRFLGLWDTVAQFGPLGGANPTWRLDIPTAVRATFHAVALNEHRRLFPLESVRASSAWVLERGFIGSHADVGGGNAESDLSDVSLVWMTQMARALDVPVREPPLAHAWVSDPLVHDRNYLGYGDRTVYERDASGRVLRQTAQRETVLPRMSWSDTLRFLIPYPRRGIDALGQPSIVARVDMQAYAEWLVSTYGIEIGYSRSQSSASPGS